MDQVPSLTEELGRKYRSQKIHDHINALRYLFLMLPPVNLKMLREILELLFCISEQEKLNKMTAFNLGVMFAPHILWPRHVSIRKIFRHRSVFTCNKCNKGYKNLVSHTVLQFFLRLFERKEDSLEFSVFLMYTYRKTSRYHSFNKMVFVQAYNQNKIF